MRTQVGIIGAGPAGLVLALAHLLHLEGIESVVIEDKSRHYIEHRLRAGLLEQGSAEILVETGVGERLLRERMLHDGLYIKFAGELHRIDFRELVGKSVMIYPQQDIVSDLVAVRMDYGAPLLFEVSDVSVGDIDQERPMIRFKEKGEPRTLECDYIAGCDGFHGISRPSIPKGKIKLFERDYPFAWLGILAEAPRPRMSSSTRTMSAGLRSSPCAHRRSAGFICRSGAARTSRCGPTIASGASCASGPRVARAGSFPKGRSSRKASPTCAASRWSPCSTGASSSLATRRTSFRLPVQKA